MNNELQIQSISGMCTALMENDPEYFLVDVRIALGNHIRIFIDGDSGVAIDKCVALNRALYKQLEESAVFNGDFSLEVSSPGLDEPLKLHRQYQKNVGRHLEVVTTDGALHEGKLIAVHDEDIVIEKTAGKKKDVVLHTLLFQNIKTTKILVVF